MLTAISKYMKGQQADDISESVLLLINNCLVPNLPLPATIVSNDFRSERLYYEEVDVLFKKHAVLIKAMYSRYRLKPPGGGLRPKTMKIDGWLQLMEDAHLIDSQFTLQVCGV